MENKIIKQNGLIYNEIVPLTENLRIRNTDLRWEDFLNKDGPDKGYINFAKLYKLKPLYICIFTGYGTGKTFGLTKHVLLDRNENLGLLNNTTNGAQEGIKGLLGQFASDGYDTFDDWTIQNLNAFDGEGNNRIRAGGMRSKGNLKMGRDFYTRNILFDEFNQNNDQAEIMGQSPIKTIDTIQKRWADDDNHPLDHIWLFGNKDGRKNMLSVKIMEELGIYGTSEYTEIFYVESRSDEMKEIDPDFWVQNVVVLNPKIDKEKQTKIIKRWLADPEKYKSNLSMLISGTAQVGMFNDDSNSWIFDNIYFKFRQDHGNLIFKTWYLWNKGDDWFEINLLKMPNDLNNSRIWMRQVHDKPKSKDLYSWGAPKVDGMQKLSLFTKDEIIGFISSNKILYDKIATKVQFLQNFIK